MAVPQDSHDVEHPAHSDRSGLRERESPRRLDQGWIDLTGGVARLEAAESPRHAETVASVSLRLQGFGPSEAGSLHRLEFPETGQFRVEVSDRAGQERADRECARHGRRRQAPDLLRLPKLLNLGMGSATSPRGSLGLDTKGLNHHGEEGMTGAEPAAHITVVEENRMNWKRTVRWSWLIMPFLLLAIWPGTAAAGHKHKPVPPDPDPVALNCGNLPAGKSCIYETTENARFTVGEVIRRISTAAAQGKVAAGSPICKPDSPGALPCDITVVATDRIDTTTGRGPIEGTFAIVANEPGTADLPEIVELKGRLEGVVDISMAGAGLGSIAGRWQAKGVGHGKFTGTLRFPFPFAPLGPGFFYVNAAGSFGVRAVAANEMVLALPALLFEIEFEQ